MVFDSNAQPLSVAAGNSAVFGIRVDQYFRSARLAGNVMASGGSNHDIRVVVLKNNRVVFDSGQRRSIVLSVDLSEPGDYRLVLDNTFSLLSSKQVVGRISLVDWGVDSERAESARMLYLERSERASRLLRRLYDTLRQGEFNWGTEQVSRLPQLVIVKTDEVNAGAAFWTNTILLNEGLFVFAEADPANTDSILAGVIAHELGHIFYRHFQGSRPGSLWDELTGASPIDRNQEREADFLGVQLTCRAGLDPSGVLRFHQQMARRGQGRGSFGQTHPAPSERLQYLTVEVSKCRDRISRRPEASHEVGNASSPDRRPYLRRQAPTAAPSTVNPNCLDYEPKRVSLKGTVIKHDGLRAWWGLKLDTPICTNAGPDEDQGLAHTGIHELHLVVSSKLHWAQIVPLQGKSAVLSGRLMLAITGHHMTPVLLQVDEVHNSPVQHIPPQKPKEVSSRQPLPESYSAKVTVMQSPVNRVITMAWATDPSKPFKDADEFVTHYFNGPMDIMWVECRAGYRIVAPESPSSSSVFPMDGPGSKIWGVAVAPQGESAIRVTCIR